jgi:nicotinamidase-related amidase
MGVVMRKTIVFITLLFLMVSTGLAQEKAEAKSKRMHPALVVIDIQNQFLTMVPEREKEVGLYMINAFIELFRKNGFQVIRVHHTDPVTGPVQTSEAFQFPATIQVKSDDPMVIKNYPNSFKKTGLNQILQDKKCNTVFLCGLSSVGCVLATYFGAYDLDYRAFMLKDAIMSHNSAFTDNVEDIFGAVNYETVEIMLENAEK